MTAVAQPNLAVPQPPSSVPLPKIPTLARRIVATVACLWVATLVIVFALRVGFALELEWMEGGSIQQAMRMQFGLPTYGPPSADFVPFLYTPFYPTILATLGSVFPLGLMLGRVVSIAAWLATCVGIWKVIVGEGKPRAHALAAIGLFCSGSVFGFRWYDVARPDMVMLALVVWGLYLLRHSQGSARRAVAAGLLMGLAFWTKQTAAIVILASGVGGLLLARRNLWRYVLTIFVVDAIGLYIGMWRTDNWLWTYIYELHQAHAFNHERFRSKTWGMFAHAAPWLVVWVGALLGQRLFERITRWRHEADSFVAATWLWLRSRLGDGSGFWALLAGAGLLASALGYATQWAEPNAFIPGVCFVAIWLGVTLPQGGTLERIGLGLIGAQLVFSAVIEPFYQPIQQHGLRPGLAASYRLMDPMRTLPSTQQRTEALAFVDSLQHQQGEVFALHRPWWSILAGGPGHVGSMGLNDIPSRDRARIRLELRTALRAGRYTTLWFDRLPPAWMLGVMTSRFRLARRLAGDTRLLPLSGYMSKAGMVTPYRDPQLMFEWIEPQAPELPPGVSVLADFESRNLEPFFPRIKGSAFTRVAIPGLHGVLRRKTAKTQPVGPHGGKLLVSSAASGAGLRGRGQLDSTVFTLPETGGSLSLMLGYAGEIGPKLTVELIAEDHVPTLIIPFDANTPQWSMTRVIREIPPAWAGAKVHLQVSDASTTGAVFLDDIWLHSNSPQTP